MKYVIFKDNKTGAKFPVIFSEDVAHSQVKVEEATAVSAGFVTSMGKTHGSSTSLGLSPAIGDGMYLLSVLQNDQHTLNALRGVDIEEEKEAKSSNGRESVNTLASQ